ncbi:MAG: hypothetical protein ACI8XG_002177, partial [Congregibacter sp.]
MLEILSEAFGFWLLAFGFWLLAFKVCAALFNVPQGVRITFSNNIYFVSSFC